MNYTSLYTLETGRDRLFRRNVDLWYQLHGDHLADDRYTGYSDVCVNCIRPRQSPSDTASHSRWHTDCCTVRTSSTASHVFCCNERHILQDIHGGLLWTCQWDLALHVVGEYPDQLRGHQLLKKNSPLRIYLLAFCGKAISYFQKTASFHRIWVKSVNTWKYFTVCVTGG